MIETQFIQLRGVVPSILSPIILCWTTHSTWALIYRASLYQTNSPVEWRLKVSPRHLSDHGDSVLDTTLNYRRLQLPSLCVHKSSDCKVKGHQAINHIVPPSIWIGNEISVTILMCLHWAILSPRAIPICNLPWKNIAGNTCKLIVVVRITWSLHHVSWLYCMYLQMSMTKSQPLQLFHLPSTEIWISEDSSRTCTIMIK